MKTVIFFLEERSAKAMLQGLLPRVLPDGVQCRFVVFEGKQDLERNLVKRLRLWQLPESVFMIVRDQDSGDCRAIKANLTELCRQAGREEAVVRIACRELESFYLGDLAAVEKGLTLSGLVRMPNNRKYRSPDNLANPAQELVKLTHAQYQKVAGSRAIAPHLNPESNTSHSFSILVTGIRKLVGSPLAPLTSTP